MYLKSIKISNIRSIEHFEMPFKEPAGWHVLIGDNGTGKSTIVKSAALALLELNDINATREDWREWLSHKAVGGEISLKLFFDERYENTETNAPSETINRPAINASETVNGLVITRRNSFENSEEEVGLAAVMFAGHVVYHRIRERINSLNITDSTPTTPSYTRTGPWFSAAYGPYRRFTGGNQEKEKLYTSNPRLGAHLSVFGEDVALSEALIYLRELYIKKLEKRPEGEVVDWIFKFINEAQLLPHGTKIKEINSDGIFFTDGNGNTITAVQMSDGFRSVLSLTFELIRQLIRAYGQDAVFKDIKAGNMVIDLPGVVLIDEIDAHLHPTWQTRIGFWFLQYFPSLQFIVTTHSPLICRACEKGSIWRLAAPGSDVPSGEVTGTDRDRLIFGNVLDAYSTEVFGRDVERSPQSKAKLERLAKLGMLNSFGKISEAEKKELDTLRKILSTDDPTEF
jgi:predicted ATPase